MLISDPKDIHVEKEIEEGTDRVCAVLGAAYLEEKLTTAIKTRLVQDEDSTHKLLKPSGPVGDLGSKADLGYLLGLYSKSARDDIRIIAQVRNWFAHWTKTIDFDSRDIRRECAGLSGLPNVYIFDPKDFDPAYNLARKKWLYTIGAIATLIVRYSEMPREVPGPIF